MSLSPSEVKTYHVFLASPGDVAEERRQVRQFFERYNRHHARQWNVRFEVIDWENYSTIGVGRPQDLITQQTLEKYKNSLALVVGIMAQRFGMPTGKAESGTEEEFLWALENHQQSGWPQIKWFFRRIEQFVAPADPAEITRALNQWRKVRAFQKRLRTSDPPIYYGEYAEPADFQEVLQNDLNLWLSDEVRPWVPSVASAPQPPAESTPSDSHTIPAEFDLSVYRQALIDRFDVLNFEMLDVSGAYYGGVRLWNVFVPQSVRECHEYAPHLLEMPKEHIDRLIAKGEVDTDELAEAERLQDERRRQYLNQPVRPVLDTVDDGQLNRCVLLGDPGSGKSALLRYLAIRWARLNEAGSWDETPVPLLVELRDYHRWNGQDDRNLLLYLQADSSWHRLNQPTLHYLTTNPERVILLLDGLDEIFDPADRARVADDIQQFSRDFPQVPIVMTSRVVGYRSDRFRDAQFRHLMIQDLNESQIETFLGFWHDITFDNIEDAQKKRERLLQAIQRSSSIAQLAGNPLLLTMMAILNRNQRLPDDRVDLYAQCSRLLLHQWDIERTLGQFPGLSDEIGLREKTDILRTVAYAMQTRLSDKSRANYIDGATLTSLIEDYLHTELRFEQSRAVARALVEQLRTRNFILCDLGADSYAFVHRTFLEYFCAADIVHQFNVTKTLSEQQLIDLFDTHCRDDDWREVLRLICGQIDEQVVGRIIEHLATRTDLDSWNQKTPLSELSLAIWCLSEVRTKTKLESAGSQLLTTVVRLLSLPDSYKLENFMRQEVLGAAQSVGRSWPGRSTIIQSSLSAMHENRGAGAIIWAEFTSTILRDRELGMKLLASTSPDVRAGAVLALGSYWPDEETRKLLTQQVVQDEHEYPRSFALRTLAEKWPDEETRKLLTQQAVQDEHEFPRSTALQTLAEKWPDEETRKLLAQQAVQDEDEYLRSTALQTLAEKWPDEDTRQLLTRQAVHDEDSTTRSTALSTLAEKWPDEDTRELLTKQAIQDEHHHPRSTALSTLAEKWPDEDTRELLTKQAIQDKVNYVRRTALRMLAEKWPDEGTHKLLTQRALHSDLPEEERNSHGIAIASLHSEFGRIVYTKYFDGLRPYLDLLKPIPWEHIDGAARAAGIPPNEIDAKVASLSEFLGWDVTRGVNAD